MVDKIIEYNKNNKMYIDIITSEFFPIFAIVYFDEQISYEKAKELIVSYEKYIKKAALEYVKDKEIEEKIINSTFTIISDEHDEKKFYVEFDELED
ncbi:hypothetical protein [Methanocaldococcus sp.]